MHTRPQRAVTTRDMLDPSSLSRARAGWVGEKEYGEEGANDHERPTSRRACRRSQHSRGLLAPWCDRRAASLIRVTEVSVTWTVPTDGRGVGAAATASRADGFHVRQWARRERAVHPHARPPRGQRLVPPSRPGSEANILGRNCGIHPENRARTGVDPFNAQNLAKKISRQGYSGCKLENLMGFEKAVGRGRLSISRRPSMYGI